MAAYSDEEQIEVIRKWWEENGTGIVVAIVLAVVALLGWRQWQAWEEDKAEAASIEFGRMMDAFEQASGRPDSEAEHARVKDSAEQLVEQHGDTAYGDFARLMLARLAVEEEQYDEAAARLREVVQEPETDALRWIATLRLARVLVQQDAPAEALALLEGTAPDAFAGQVQELRGDILTVQGDLEGARAAYAAALENLQNGTPHRRLVELKLSDLGSPS